MRKFNKPAGKSDGKKKPFRSEGGSSRSGGKKGDFKAKRPFKRSDSDSSEKESYGSDKYKRDGYKGKSSSYEKRPFKRSNNEEASDRSYGSSEKKYSSSRDKKPFGKDKREGSGSYGVSDKKFSRSGDKKSFSRKEEGSSERSFGSSDRKEGGFRDKKPFSRRKDDSSEKSSGTAERKAGGFRKPFKHREEDERELSYKEKRSFTRNKALRKGGPKKEGHFRGDFERDSFKKNDKYSEKGSKFKSGEKRKFTKEDHHAFKGDSEGPRFEKRLKYDELEEGKGFAGSYSKEKRSSSSKAKKPNLDGLTRLNKYLANAGIASRREADTLIQSGVVKVNGVPVTEMGFKVKPGDVVTYGDENVKSEKKVYLLLNKPKDYITTVDDPQERRTVMELIEGACKERIYPVGRLDRNTTGLLLFTNDGELTKKLTHPKHQIKKIYHVSLNKGLKPEDFKQILEGVELEDGFIAPDDLAFVGEGKKEIGIEIHSGRNRIVRRIFEHLGYEIEKLDRVGFAGLTKKDLPRGKHRFLTPKEVSFLQMIG